MTRKTKTPGGRIVLQYTGKRGKGPQTPVGDLGRIHGVRSAAALLRGAGRAACLRFLPSAAVLRLRRPRQVPHLRPAMYSKKRMATNKKTVNRAYGGVLSGGAVRDRIMRAFLVEEQKIVKKVLKTQAKAAPKESK